MIKLKSLLVEQTTVYKQGMSDPKVGTKEGPIAKIQQKLIAAKMMPPIPDAQYGIYGPKTVAAVKQFQTANNLKVDGIVGKNTIEALNKISTPANTTSAAGVMSAKQIADKLIAVADTWNNDPPAVQQAVMSIKDQTTYDAVNKLLNNTKKYKDLIHYIDSELGIFDRDRRIKLLNYIKQFNSTDTRLNRTYFEKTVGPMLFNFLDKYMGKDVIGPKFLQQYLLPKNLTDADFDNFDRQTISSIIGDAIKLGEPTNKGGVSYKAYDTKIAELLDKKFDAGSFQQSLSELGTWPVKLLNRLRFAFLFGRFNYELDSKTNTYTIVEDPYDFSKSGSIKNWPSDNEIKGKTTSEVLQLIKDKNNIGDSWSEWYQLLRAYGSIKDPESKSDLVTMTMSNIPIPNNSGILSKLNIV